MRKTQDDASTSCDGCSNSAGSIAIRLQRDLGARRCRRHGGEAAGPALSLAAGDAVLLISWQRLLSIAD
jgi:hypothetical protein